MSEGTDGYRHMILAIRTYCGVWPINKCREGSKTNKSNCRFWKKSTFDWLWTILVRIYLARDLGGYLAAASPVISDEISSNSPQIRLVNVAALLRRY
jgi:hypothetical protein